MLVVLDSASTPSVFLSQTPKLDVALLVKVNQPICGVKADFLIEINFLFYFIIFDSLEAATIMFGCFQSLSPRGLNQLSLLTTKRFNLYGCTLFILATYSSFGCCIPSLNSLLDLRVSVS